VEKILKDYSTEKIEEKLDLLMERRNIGKKWDRHLFKAKK
jgi:hypothetical protein